MQDAECRVLEHFQGQAETDHFVRYPRMQRLSPRLYGNSKSSLVMDFNPLIAQRGAQRSNVSIEIVKVHVIT